jgi:RNA recognition motif-containing protein
MEVRNQRRGGRRRRSSYPRRRDERDNRRNGYEPKKSGGILAFFKNLFGGKKTQNGTYTNGHSEERSNGAFSSPRPEQPVEVATAKLYVGNLAYDTTESDLYDYFQKVGAVKNVEIVRDRRSQSKGFGFVEMESIDSAKSAAERFNRTEFMGRQLVVNGAKS